MKKSRQRNNQKVRPKNYASGWPQIVETDLAVGRAFLDQTKLQSTAEIKDFRKRILAGKFVLPKRQTTLFSKVKTPPHRLPKLQKAEALAFERMVKKRKSTRLFRRGQLTPSQLRFILENSLGGAIARAGNIDCVEVTLWIRGVKGIPKGFYSYDHDRQALLRVPPRQVIKWQKEGLADHTAVVICLRLNPQNLLEAYGARSWRFQWIALGSVWAHMYLASSAIGVGCCGHGGLNDLLGMSRLDSPEVWTAGFLQLGCPA